MLTKYFHLIYNQPLKKALTLSRSSVAERQPRHILANILPNGPLMWDCSCCQTVLFCCCLPVSCRTNSIEGLWPCEQASRPPATSVASNFILFFFLRRPSCHKTDRISVRKLTKSKIKSKHWAILQVTPLITPCGSPLTEHVAYISLCAFIRLC